MDIFNHLVINKQLITGGHPSKDSFKKLSKKGVAVVIDAQHQCMTTRGTHKSESSTITSRMLGLFRTNSNTRNEFMNLINSANN